MRNFWERWQDRYRREFSTFQELGTPSTVFFLYPGTIVGIDQIGASGGRQSGTAILPAVTLRMAIKEREILLARHEPISFLI